MVSSRLANNSKLWLTLLTLFGLITFAAIGILSSQEHNGADAPKCRPIYMFPSYAKINGFGTSHSKFSSKYNLFLYREQGKDKVPDEDDKSGYILDGIPVLFIPGNAGSYKQVRSIAAESANIIHNNKDNEYFKGRNLDFFAAHFNEDFTAFHGRTMLDQAEYLNDAIRYILSLYKDQANPPESVILLGHSMGGVVCRLMLTLPNYVENSVNSIVTLSAPHAAAPATFDGDVLRVYGEIDKFWRQGFDDEEETVPSQRLKNVSLISITGGLLDNILPADYTTLEGLVPKTNGFTMYTTGIPGVWTPIDHLAIVWCDQLRKVIASTLVDVVDPSIPSRSYDLEKRMKIFRKKLLSGFEDYATQDFLGNDHNDDIQISNEVLKISNGDSDLLTSGSSHFIDLRKVSNDSVFNFISSSQPSAHYSKEKNSYLAVCNRNSGSLQERDFESRGLTSNQVKLTCKSLSKDVYSVPRSSNGLDASESSFGGNHSPFYAAQLDYKLLKDYDLILFSSSNDFPSDAFTAWSIESEKTHSIRVPSNLFSYFMGVTIYIPSSKSLARNIQFDSLKSSLLGYKVNFNVKKRETNAFEPFARQWIPNPFETKWHLNLNEDKKVSIHGNAPYTPFKNKENPLHIQLWALFNDEHSSITIRIDVLHTLKLWVLRYRLAVASLPVFIITLTLISQILSYAKNGIFPSFENGLLMLTKFALPIGVFALILTPLTSNETIQKMLYAIDFISSNNPDNLRNAHVNPLFLGLQEKELWIFGPIFLTIALSLVYTVNKILQVLSFLIRSVVTFLKHRFSSKLNSVKELQAPAPINKIQNNRRLVGSVLLLGFVMFYVPYQFAYVVCCVVQATVCLKAELKSHDNFKEKGVPVAVSNNSNYNMSILMLMLWIVPVNVPVLVVFLHNMAVRWETPFSSHHNILAILPIMLVLSKHVKGEILPQPRFKLQKQITVGILAYFGLFSLIYGVRSLYWLHYLLNVFFAWVFILFYEGSIDRNNQNN